MDDENRGSAPSLNPNYIVSPSRSLDAWLGISFGQLEARDSNAILQMVFNFSAALGKLNSDGNSPRILETGSGFSSQIFYSLLPKKNLDELVSIDYGGLQATENNSRHVVDLGKVFGSDFATLSAAPTIDLRDLETVYGGSEPATWRPSGLDAAKLSPFVDLRLDNRRRAQIESATRSTFDINTISSDILGGSLSDSEIIKSYRSAGDELELLKSIESKGVLADTLREGRPNLIFLDSGEFSTLPEFLIVDDLAEIGAVLLVQDIIFPKSIKGFLIGALVAASSRWEVLWIDRSTPQGMLAAIRKPA